MKTFDSYKDKINLLDMKTSVKESPKILGIEIIRILKAITISKYLTIITNRTFQRLRMFL